MSLEDMIEAIVRRVLRDELAAREAKPAVDLLVSISAAARMVGVHPNTLRRAARCGALKSERVGRDWRVLPSEVRAWLDGGGRTRAKVPGDDVDRRVQAALARRKRSA